MDHEEMEKCFEWLDSLRKSGTTNMLLARQPLARALILDRKTSTEVLGLWMRSFNPLVPVYERARWAIKQQELDREPNEEPTDAEATHQD